MLLQKIRGFAEASGMSLSEERSCYLLEKVLAERGFFLCRRKLLYRVRLRIDDACREVHFTELLKESGLGFTSGHDGASVGTGFRKEILRAGPGPREGSIEEQSRLFGRDYSYTFDYGAFRRSLEGIVRGEGYAFIWKYSL